MRSNIWEYGLIPKEDGKTIWTDFVKKNIEQITDVNKKYTYYDKIIKFLEEYSEKNKPGQVVEAFNNPLEDLIAKYKNLRQQPPKDYRPIDIYINPRYRIRVYIIKIYINGEGPYIYRIKPEKLKQWKNTKNGETTQNKKLQRHKG